MVGKHHVWVWGNEGKKILYNGSKSKCKDFKKQNTGYRQADIYISMNND